MFHESSKGSWGTFRRHTQGSQKGKFLDRKSDQRDAFDTQTGEFADECVVVERALTFRFNSMYHSPDVVVNRPMIMQSNGYARICR